MMKLLVIGNGAAGATAAFEARKFDEDADITIITSDKYTHYSPCGLPFALAGKYKVKDLIVYPPSLYKMSDIDLYLETEVVKISTDENVVYTKDREFEYDRLIIATGSKPVVPQIKGLSKDRIYTLSTIDDGEKICNAIENKNMRSVVVIGAGLIGLEAAAALKERGLDVVVVEIRDRILPRLLDDDIAGELIEHLKGKGVEFMLNERVVEITGKKKVQGVLLGSGDIIPCDMVLLASGMKANTSLAGDAGIKLGNLNGINVNKKMETSTGGVYAAGDCVESIHAITGLPTYSMIGSTAVREGKVAGVNACGGDLKIHGVFNTTITKLSGITVGFVGLNTQQAEKYDFDIVSSTFEGLSRDSFFPGGKRIVIKMIGDRKTGKIIGAQLLGKEGVFARLLAISFAMQDGADVYDLAFKETTYVPPISPTFDPITLAAEMLMRRMND